MKEKHDQRMKHLQLYKNKLKFQETLRNQIQEQKRLKSLEKQSEIQQNQKTLDQLKKQCILADKKQLELKK